MIITPRQGIAKNAANYREIYETFLVAAEEATIHLNVSGNTSIYALHPELVTTENKSLAWQKLSWSLDFP